MGCEEMRKSKLSFAERKALVEDWFSTADMPRTVADRHGVTWGELYFWVDRYEKWGDDGLTGESMRGRMYLEGFRKELEQRKHEATERAIRKDEEEIARLKKKINELWKKAGLPPKEK